jgi:peptide/nickel transport system substrate-binding protein
MSANRHEASADERGAEHLLSGAEHLLTRRDVLQRAAAVGLGLTGVSALTGTSALASGEALAATPKRGGRLRVAIVGGGGAETFDPGLAVSTATAILLGQVFDRFVYVPKTLVPQPALVTFEPNAAATKWTARIRSGVVWHDGKPFTVDDVIYTLRRISGPKQAGATLLEAIDIPRLRKLDARTVSLPLKRPFANLPYQFTTTSTSVIQNGATDFSKPIGTGPFILASFTPGDRALFKRNPNYWREGQPYVDELEIVEIPDPAARLNALLAGQVDAIEGLTYPQARQHQKSGDIQVLVAKSAATIPITMAVDLRPFRDNRVRQAVRLAADRPALLSGALLGFGELGNDLFCKGFKYYNSELPQRKHDPQRAAFLLKQAGVAGASVTLYTSTLQAGMLESATLFAQQASKVGLKVNINNGPAGSYFTSHYLKAAFAQTLWGPVPLSYWFPQATTSNAPFNETHWKHPHFDALVRRASGELNEAKARTIWYDVQEMLWKDGGYLLWGFIPYVDGIATNVQGVEPNGFFLLDNATFRKWWLA